MKCSQNENCVIIFCMLYTARKIAMVDENILIAIVFKQMRYFEVWCFFVSFGFLSVGYTFVKFYALYSLSSYFAHSVLREKSAHAAFCCIRFSEMPNRQPKAKMWHTDLPTQKVRSASSHAIRAVGCFAHQNDLFIRFSSMCFFSSFVCVFDGNGSACFLAQSVEWKEKQFNLMADYTSRVLADIATQLHSGHVFGFGDVIAKPAALVVGARTWFPLFGEHKHKHTHTFASASSNKAATLTETRHTSLRLSVMAARIYARLSSVYVEDAISRVLTCFVSAPLSACTARLSSFWPKSGCHPKSSGGCVLWFCRSLNESIIWFFWCGQYAGDI